MKNDGGPAFPHDYQYAELDASERQITGGERKRFGGMTLRDYFAGQALAGLSRGVGLDLERHDLARRSYAIADAMLAERAKE